MNKLQEIAERCKAQNWEKADLDYEQYAKLLIQDIINHLEIQKWSDGYEIRRAIDLIRQRYGVW